MTPRRLPPERGGVTPRLLLAALTTGAASGGLAIALSALLRFVQHAAFHYQHGPFVSGVAQASDLRRVVAVTLSGVVAGLGWWGLQRTRGGLPRIDVDAALTGEQLTPQAGFTGAVLQIVTVGLGSPLGREGAPREAGATAGNYFATRLGLTRAQRRLIIAAGSGAGLAAVYNIPVGGALFTLEVLLRSRRPRDIIIAAVTSGVATAVSFLGLPDTPTYHVRAAHVTVSLCVFALLVGPVVGVFSAAFARTMRRARARSFKGARGLMAATLVGAAVGGLSAWEPQLLGNGKGPVQLSLEHALSVSPLLILLFLRPLVTAATLRAGVVGGLLTPAFASGALLGVLTGAGWNYLWPGTAFAGFVLVTASVFLGAAQRAPLMAIALGIEFTHAGGWFVLPIVLATLGASACARPLSGRAAP